MSPNTPEYLADFSAPETPPVSNTLEKLPVVNENNNLLLELLSMVRQEAEANLEDHWLDLDDLRYNFANSYPMDLSVVDIPDISDSWGDGIFYGFDEYLEGEGEENQGF